MCGRPHLVFKCDQFRVHVASSPFWGWQHFVDEVYFAKGYLKNHFYSMAHLTNN